MRTNMGRFDRVSRLIAGIALIAIGAAGGNNLPLLVLGTVAAVTGAIGFCPVYVPFRFDTLDVVEGGPHRTFGKKAA